MKKVFSIIFICFILLGLTGCIGGRVKNRNSVLYNKELSFDFDSMDTISADIKRAIEEGIEDAAPITMENGHFRIERNNYTYEYEEGTAKTKVNFYNFEIDARPDENNSIVYFKGFITIDFESTVDGSEYGGDYIIKNKNHKVIEFEINNRGTATYDEKTGNFTIVIPEIKETGTITQTGQKTTTTKSGYEEVGKPVTNTWALDDTWKNVKILFVPHSESK